MFETIADAADLLRDLLAGRDFEELRPLAERYLERLDQLEKSGRSILEVERRLEA